MKVLFLCLFAVFAVCEEQTTESFQDILDYAPLNGIEEFFTNNSDPTDRVLETLKDGGKVSKIVLKNKSFLKEDENGYEIYSGLPDVFCFYTLCVNSCHNNNTVCWTPKRCHSNEECSGLSCATSCGQNILSGIETMYRILVDIPKQVNLINKKLEEVIERKRTTVKSG